MIDADDRRIIDLFFEAGQLKRQPRSGWLLLGITQPESIADHTCRSVLIAYVLAKLESANPEKAALIAAFHEIPETRIGDLNKMTQAYFTDKRSVERKILRDQAALLPKEIGDEFIALLHDFEDDTTPEQTVARDADYLEVILQAKEYLDQGYAGAQNWIENATTRLRTETAKRLAKRIAATRSTEWCEGLKRIRR